MPRRGISLLCVAVLALSTGCTKSTTPLGGRKSASTASSETSLAGGKDAATAGPTVVGPAGWKAPEVTTDGWAGYPSVPYVPVANDLDGTAVPRVFDPPEGYVAGGEVPADVNNPAAKGRKSEPTIGGSITIRFNAEPKTLNWITETSAYRTYVLQYVQDSLAAQNPETFEFEPAAAQRWVVEDSVKLRPDYPGHERRVAQAGGQPAATLAIDITSVKKDDGSEEPQPVSLTVTDKDGKPVPKAWVGLRSKAGGQIAHRWTDAAGKIDAAADEPGRYDVLVGDELYGELKEEGDGYVLTASSPSSDGKAPAEPLNLSKADVANVERQTVFTYFLRDGVTWQDGTPFTTKDLQFAYAVINNPFVDDDQLRVYYESLVALDPLDARTVRMKYRQQYFQAFEFTADLAAYAPPWHLFEKLVREKGKTLTFDPPADGESEASETWSVHGQPFGKFFNQEERYSRAPLGIGPYAVQEWSRQDRRLILKRRADYWNKEKAGYLDQIIVKFVEDTQTALRALRAGEIDFMWRLNQEQFYEELEPAPTWLKDNYVKAAWFSPGFAFVGWNARKPCFQDRRVRLALAMLFDKKEFFEKKLHGSGVLVSGPQYYFGPAYDHTVGSVGYDPQAAKDLLADAGWIDTDGDGLLDKDGEPFRFDFLYPPGNPMYDALAELLQRSLRQAGIDMQAQRMEWAAFTEQLQSRNFDAVTLMWSGSLENDPYQIWHSSGATPGSRGSNAVSFANPEADRLIERIRVTLNKEERRRLSYSFHRVLDREQPYTFLWTPKDLGLYHQRYRGVKLYALRPGFDLREWYVPRELQGAGQVAGR